MSDPADYPRFAEARLLEALADSPAVLVHGPRQSGKTTLAQTVGNRLGYAYLTFDDETVREAARSDPFGFVADLPARTILDEVQWVPELFATLKAAIDRDRTPGRFMLTGSANVLLLPRLSDSLAGRMDVLRLHPLAQAEIERKAPRFLEQLFTGAFQAPPKERLGSGLIDRVVAGGYPAALARSTARRRVTWYVNYLDALVQGDVRDLSRVSALDALPRLLAVAAAHTAQLLNVAGLAAPFQLSRPTINDYLTLLERVYLLDRLPPWHSNRLSRLVKTSKLHVGDTGLACALLGMDADALRADRSTFGHLLETFVYQELRRQGSWYDAPLTFFHFRDRDGVEVDMVIERGAHQVVGVEVKAAATVTAADFRGLRKLREATGTRFRSGVVLYDGETTASFGDGMYAVPISSLWETT
jgi:uncharacterized protein